MSAVTKIKDYFLGAYGEARKVTWPSKKQTTYYSLVVVGITLTVAIFFAVVDYALNLGLAELLK